MAQRTLIRVDFYEFEKIRETGRLKAEQPYALKGAFGQEDEYAWSPDGEGVYYYETLAELQAEHG